MWNAQSQWRPFWKCHNMWHIRKMLLMLLLNSVQSLTVLTFCAQLMGLAALWYVIVINTDGDERHIFQTSKLMWVLKFRGQAVLGLFNLTCLKTAWSTKISMPFLSSLDRGVGPTSSYSKTFMGTDVRLEIQRPCTR